MCPNAAHIMNWFGKLVLWKNLGSATVGDHLFDEKTGLGLDFLKIGSTKPSKIKCSEERWDHFIPSVVIQFHDGIYLSNQLL